MVKNLPANVGDAGDERWIHRLGRSPGVGNGNLVLHSCLENPMDRGAWWATAHGVTKSWTQLTPMQADGGMYLVSAALKILPVTPAAACWEAGALFCFCHECPVLVSRALVTFSSLVLLLP